MYTKIGISGGTFNPVHLGHLILAEDLRQKYQLEKVLFIPSGIPPHKNYKKVAPSEHRLHMVELAVESNPFFEVSRIEIDRQGLTYTVDTLEELKKLYGTDVKLNFITGADIIRDLTSWRDPERIFGLCEFLIAVRPGFPIEGMKSDLTMLKRDYGARIELVDIPQVDISSTLIRERIKAGKSIKYLVPESVENYIIKNNLYMEQ